MLVEVGSTYLEDGSNHSGSMWAAGEAMNKECSGGQSCFVGEDTSVVQHWVDRLCWSTGTNDTWVLRLGQFNSIGAGGNGAVR